MYSGVTTLNTSSEWGRGCSPSAHIWPTKDNDIGQQSDCVTCHCTIHCTHRAHSVRIYVIAIPRNRETAIVLRCCICANYSISYDASFLYLISNIFDVLSFSFEALPGNFEKLFRTNRVRYIVLLRFCTKKKHQFCWK